MSHALAIVLSLLRLGLAAWAFYWVIWIVYFNRRRGFEPRPLGWVMAALATPAAGLMSFVSIFRLFGATPSAPVSVADIVATLISMLLLAGPIPGRWLGRARPNIRELIETANSLVELGKLAPDNGARAFQKAFDLYNQARLDAPQSFAATYGCGLSLYELSKLEPNPTRGDLIDRAQYWFKKALAVDAKGDLQTFVAEIDEFRESIREA